jgi:hypothetical protein
MLVERTFRGGKQSCFSVFKLLTLFTIVSNLCLVYFVGYSISNNTQPIHVTGWFDSPEDNRVLTFNPTVIPYIVGCAIVIAMSYVLGLYFMSLELRRVSPYVEAFVTQYAEQELDITSLEISDCLEVFVTDKVRYAELELEIIDKTADILLLGSDPDNYLLRILEGEVKELERQRDSLTVELPEMQTGSRGVKKHVIRKDMLPHLVTIMADKMRLSNDNRMVDLKSVVERKISLKMKDILGTYGMTVREMRAVIIGTCALFWVPTRDDIMIADIEASESFKKALYERDRLRATGSWWSFLTAKAVGKFTRQ